MVGLGVLLERTFFGTAAGWSSLVFKREFASHKNSISVLQQHYNRLPIRKKYIRAIKRGTLVWDKGQVRIPPIDIEGYDPPKYCLLPNEKNRKRQYKGRFEDIKAKRVSFYD